MSRFPLDAPLGARQRDLRDRDCPRCMASVTSRPADRRRPRPGSHVAQRVPATPSWRATPLATPKRSSLCSAICSWTIRSARHGARERTASLPGALPPCLHLPFQAIGPPRRPSTIQSAMQDPLSAPAPGQGPSLDDDHDARPRREDHGQRSSHGHDSCHPDRTMFPPVGERRRDNPVPSAPSCKRSTAGTPCLSPRTDSTMMACRSAPVKRDQ